MTARPPVRGDGPWAECCRWALSELGADSGTSCLVIAVDGDGPGSLDLDRGPSTMVRWQGGAWSSPPAVDVGLGRVLAALSATTLTLTVLAPAGWSRTPLGGPLDGVIPAAASRKRVVVLRCSQTQTFVLVVALRVSADLSLADALDRLRAAPDIVVDDVDFVFDGNAAVAEYFRDLGRPDGAFWETVIFGRTLDLDDGICTLVAACHPAAVLPDTARAIATGDGNSAASEPC